jgi:osmotically-inducible protein OsmY
VTERRDNYLSERIRERLIHDPRISEQDLLVRVLERRVTLGGNVSTPQLQQTLTAVAKELLPEYEIVNETTIVSAAEPEGEEPVS